jgi:hypothetical protein
MPIITPQPVTVQHATVTYDTVVVLNQQVQVDPATMATRVIARVGLGATNGKGGYDVLPASVRQIVINNLWADGTSDEQAAAMQIAAALATRYAARVAPPTA